MLAAEAAQPVGELGREVEAVVGPVVRRLGAMGMVDREVQR